MKEKKKVLFEPIEVPMQNLKDSSNSCDPDFTRADGADCPGPTKVRGAYDVGEIRKN